MFRHFFTIFILLMAGPKVFAENKERFNLKQSLQQAFAHSPTYLSAKNQLEAANLEEKNNFSSFFPSLDLSASHGVQGVNPDVSGLTAKTPWVSAASLSLT